jgi:regulator of sirC expression with transglutaminase-like and TPR domain
MTSAAEPSPRFIELLAGHDDRMELDEAALELARLDHIDVDRDAVLLQLDSWAAEIESRLRPGSGGAEYLGVSRQVLFGAAGLQGDAEDYFDPRNSCLDQVVERRKGLPITLALVYIEVGRRCMRPVYGIGLPGHFLAQYNDGLITAFVDCFHAGELLTREQCLDRAKELTGRVPERDTLVLSPVTKRQILSRMINNLLEAYRRRQDNGGLTRLRLLQQKVLSAAPLPLF